MQGGNLVRSQNLWKSWLDAKTPAYWPYIPLGRPRGPLFQGEQMKAPGARQGTRSTSFMEKQHTKAERISALSLIVTIPPLSASLPSAVE